jgi:hypothetical protein
MPSLFDAIKEDRDAALEAEATSAISDPVKDESLVTEPEAVEATQEAEDSSGGGEEKWGLRSWLAKAGYDTEELEELADDELEQLALQRFNGEPKEPPAQPKDGTATQPARDGEQAESPSLKVEKKEEPQQPAKVDVDDELSKLEYDHSIAQLVKQEGGKYLPVDDSPESIAAAKEANSYNRRRQDRLTKMLDDPKGTLGPWMRREMEELVSQRIKSEMEGLRQSQEIARQEEAKQRMLSDEESKFQVLKDKHKADIYKLSDDGAPRKSIRTGNLMLTEFGKEVNKNYLELAELSPTAPNSVLFEKAVVMTRKYIKPEVKAKAEPEVNKKQSFLDKARKASVDTDVSKKPATIQEAVALGTNMSLLEAIRNNEEIQDNPTVQALRNRQ